MSYSTTATYSRRRSNWNRNQNTVAFASNIKLGPVSHTVLVALMITVLGLIYLTQATKSTLYDYETDKIEGKISQLNAEKDELAVENRRLTALNEVQSSSVAKAMVKPSDRTYIGN